MPMPIAHGFLGAATVAAIHPKIKKVFAMPLFIGAFLAIAADFDFLLVVLTGNKSWHRAFSHSILFSVFVFFAIWFFLGKNRVRESLAFGLAYFSHVVLDYLVTKLGGGLELFWLFSSERFKFNQFGLSEVPSELIFIEIVAALGTEFFIFGTLFFSVFLIRKLFFNRKEQTD